MKKESKNSEQKTELLGFDRVADDLKKRLKKLGRQKQISSISVICATPTFMEGKNITHGKTKFSGGMVGDPAQVLEGLYNMALQRPEVKVLLKLCVKAIEDTEALAVTDLTKLYDSNRVSGRLYNYLHSGGR